MRTTILKYSGDCRKCGATLPVGSEAGYERRAGVFCIACMPSDPEEIRAYRQEGAERKAERLEGWAEKREQAAGAVLRHNTERYHGDVAFNTQPGHIPLRARVIRQTDRALESIRVAKGMRDKASRVRRVRVKGDAERVRDAKRAAVLEWIKIGMSVESPFSQGPCKVLKVNKKTALLQGRFGPFKDELHFLSRA